MLKPAKNMRHDDVVLVNGSRDDMGRVIRYQPAKVSVKVKDVLNDNEDGKGGLCSGGCFGKKRDEDSSDEEVLKG